MKKTENSWNFTKYPEILQKVPAFYMYCISNVYDATNSWKFFILEMLFFYPWKFLKIPEFRKKWKHWDICSSLGSTLGYALTEHILFLVMCRPVQSSYK